MDFSNNSNDNDSNNDNDNGWGGIKGLRLYLFSLSVYVLIRFVLRFHGGS